LARRILLADDSVTAQNMGRRILSDAGYEVITVNNGSAALKKVSEQAPDLIVLDVYMPGYGGLEVCQRLKEVAETARIPILLSVGKLEPFKPEEARRVRADAFIVKPFEATELLAALTKLEDKIVPQADVQRSAKGRPAGMADAGEDTGWKNRLSIPPGGKGRSPEGMDADDFGQGASGEAKKQSAEPKPEIVPAVAEVKVAAEEVAAKTAAEEKTSTRAAEVVPIERGKQEVAESKREESKREESSIEGSKIAEVAAVGPAESKPAQTAEVEKTATPGPVLVSRFGDQETASDAVAVAAATSVADKPAASTHSGPRWVAEEVTASADDTSAALEHEMEKSLAANAAYDAGHNGAIELEKNKGADAGANVPAASDTSLPAAVGADDKTAEAKAADTTVEVKATDAVAKDRISESPVPADAPAAAAVTAVSTETSQTAESRSVEIQATEVVAQLKQEAYAAAASMGAAAEAAVTEARSSENNTPATGDPGNKQQLAAAWEQWQNVRETVLNSPIAQQISEVTAATLSSMLPGSASSIEPKSEINSDAKSEMNSDVRSGKKPDLEAVEATKPSNPTAIASIVDSVLAELKPRLMEEIARKLSNEKK
jgi:twitching motility two-component system response regulator PilH